MVDLWSLRGLSWRELAKRTLRGSWEDQVFGQAARLAFYFFLGMFPALLLLLVLLDRLARTGSDLRGALLDSFGHILPQDTSAVLAKTVKELNTRADIGSGALWAVLGAAWATLNGTWAVMVGLNTAYEVREERPWWKVLTIALGLTISLAVMILVALGTMLYGNRPGATIGHHLGMSPQFVFRIIQWPTIGALVLFSCAVLYRFGPNLYHRRSRWNLPGAAIAFALWLASTLLLRIYREHISSNERMYGGLSGAATLLLWLYLTGASVLIGAEANSEIEKAATETRRPDVREPGSPPSGGDPA